MSFRRFNACCLALCLTAFAASAGAQAPGPSSPAESGPPAPELSLPEPLTPAPVDKPPTSAKTYLIVGGLAATAASYGLAVAGSYLAPDNPGAKQLRIPVAGPWMSLAKTGCKGDDDSCSPAGLVFGAILTILDGVVQAGGLAIAGEGLFLNTSSGPAAPTKKAATTTLHAVPLDFGRRGLGMGFVGTF